MALSLHKAFAVFALLPLLLPSLHGQFLTTLPEPENNVLGMDLWCTMCFGVLKLAGTEAVLWGSQTLTGTESLVDLCTKLVIPFEQTCRNLVFRMGTTIGYSSKSLGEVMDTFCLVNPFCTLSGEPSSDADLNIEPQTVIACEDCRGIVHREFSEGKYVGRNAVDSAINRFCSTLPERGATTTQEFFSCQRNLRHAALKEQAARKSSEIVLTRETLCFYLGNCPIQIMPFYLEATFRLPA